MGKEKIVLFGASQHTRYTIDIIEQEGKYEIAGILDFAMDKGSDCEGYEVLGKDEDLSEVSKSHGVKKGIVTIGDNFIRLRVVKKIMEMAPDFTFVSAIHPSTILGKNVNIGVGTVIMAGVIVVTGTSIGKHCFLATNASVDHDSSMDDYSSVSAGATVGGTVKIGYCTAIAIGANVIHGMTIGDHAIVGAGALVVNKISSHVVAYGIPAKTIRTRIEGDKYL